MNPGIGTQNYISQGGHDIFIQKSDQNGSFIWAKSIGGPGNDLGRRINDYGTHIIISGTFSDSVDFDPGTGTEMRTSNGGYDVFVLALDNNGDFLWVQTFGGTSNESFGGQEKDKADDIVVTGSYSFSMSLTIGSSPVIVNAIGTRTDVFVIKMELTTGNISWIKSIGGTSNDAGAGLVIKSDSNILIVGRYLGIMDANPDTSSLSNFSLSSLGGYSVFLLELDELGDFVNAFSFDNAYDMEVYDIELDANENIYLTGPFKGTGDFDPKSGVTNLSSNGGQDCYVVKLTSSKDLIWVKTFGGVGLDQSFDIEVGNGGEVYTAGRYSNTVDFDPSSIATTTKSSDGNTNDIFIHKLDASGNFELVYTFGKSGSDAARGLELDDDRNLYVTGYFSGTQDFDPTQSTTTLTSVGTSNHFLMKFNDAMVVGTKKIEQKPVVKLYPNPVHNQLFIEFGEGQITGINIIDLSGKIVKSILNNKVNSIDVSSLQQGIYILAIYTETGVSNSRFVKQ
jgi:hypothetical protein